MHSWNRRLTVLFAGSLLLALAGQTLAATPAQVDEAIKKGKAYLLSKQNEFGNWEEVQKPTELTSHGSVNGGQWVGVSSLATYALLAAGEKPQSAKMQQAIEFLKDAKLEGTYALGLHAQIWHMVPRDPSVAEVVNRDTRLVLDAAFRGDKNSGMYHYWLDLAKNKGAVHHSTSQYGVLGAWAVEQAGGNIPREYWQEVEDSWLADQDDNGAWAYGPGKPPVAPKDAFQGPKLSMTAAGVATLFITQDYLHSQDGLVPRGNMDNLAITKGLNWIGKNFNPKSIDLYTWYGIERIGVASGRKYIGDVDWFKVGADTLVKNQGAQGQWSYGPKPDIVGTSFALVFLSRGRAPVMMNKLEYEVTDPKTKKSTAGLWNQRARDVANLAKWVGRNIEGGLNWQVTQLKSPVEDLLEAPILYISGGGPLNFTDADQAKLKEYIEAGGIIYGNVDGARPAFAESFKKLGESMFPGLKFRKLPDDHVIYTNQQYPRSKWPVLPDVLALGNGAREFMIYSPGGDFARVWQSGQPRPVHALQLPADIFLYAVDKQNLHFKGDTYYIKPDASITPAKTIKMARIQYTGGWDPEPGGWRRIAADLNNTAKIKLDCTPVKLGENKLPGTYRIAHLTGVDEVKFDEAQRKELQEFVSKGGTLIVDTAGGRGAFATAIETELSSIFGGETARKLTENLPPDHAVFKAGAGVTEFAYRPYVRLKLGSMPKTPQLRGLEVNGRLAVLYTPMDMSVGLVGQQVDGIYGYDPKTSLSLMSTLLQYADANR